MEGCKPNEGQAWRALSPVGRSVHVGTWRSIRSARQQSDAFNSQRAISCINGLMPGLATETTGTGRQKKKRRTPHRRFVQMVSILPSNLVPWCWLLLAGCTQRPNGGDGWPSIIHPLYHHFETFCSRLSPSSCYKKSRRPTLHFGFVFEFPLVVSCPCFL